MLGPLLESPEAPRGLPSLTSRQRFRVWRDAERTVDFWTTLKPFEPTAIARLCKQSIRRRWEIFFITQRPWTQGETVQCQTQRWLVEHGFDLPTVIVHNGSRGELAAALELDVLLDDRVQHCVDVLSESTAIPMLVLRRDDPQTAANAERLGIRVVRSVAQSLDYLEEMNQDG